MGMPMIIGAGVGALSSAAMGKSPFTGALLGGATGGMFGGSESLFGNPLSSLMKPTDFAGGIPVTGGAIPSVGINELGTGAMLNSNIAQVPLENLAGSWNIGQGALPATTTEGAFAGGIPLSTGDLAGNGANISRLFNYTPPTAMEKIQGAGSDLLSYGKDNPLTVGKTALELATPTPQQPIQAQTGGITRGNYDPSTSLFNVPPSYGLSKEEVMAGKKGQIGLLSQLTDPQKVRLKQFAPSLFGDY